MKTYGQAIWQGVSSLRDALYHVQYDAHCLSGIMRRFPTSFRFENSGLQRELWAAVERLNLGASQEPDGTLRFKAEDWGAINLEAHKLRDKRFGQWYFMNLSPEAMFTRMVQRLRADSLPYEV